MEPNKQLDNLFEQARKASPQVGFDEVKMEFLQASSIGVKPNSGASKFLTTKFWTIMITALITTTTVLSFLFTEPNEALNTPSKEARKIEYALFVSPQKIEPFDVNENSALPAQPTLKLAEQHTNTQNSTLETEVEGDSALLQHKANERTATLNDPEFRFPVFTEQEIKMYQKQMAFMTKQWSKPDKYQEFIPKGKVWYNKNVSTNAYYISKTEVSNLEYRTFMWDLLQQGRKEDFKAVMPKQSLWNYADTKNNSIMAEKYFSHPDYDHYPVNNISVESAQMYCEWLTIQMHEGSKPNFGQIRLPYIEEWIRAAEGSYRVRTQWDTNNFQNDQGCYYINFSPKEGANADGGEFTVPVHSYLTGWKDVYCINGNVAEYVIMKRSDFKIGIMGGSFLSSKEELGSLKPIKGNADEPRVDVGFRVVRSDIGFNRKRNSYKKQKELEKKYAYKMGKYNASGEFQFPELSQKEINNYNGYKPFHFNVGFGSFNSFQLIDETQDSSGVTTGYFMQKTVVTNLEYRIFLVDLLQQNRLDDYVTAMPKENVWSTSADKLELLDSVYLSLPAYDLYPVVGVSKAGIDLYCSWLVENLNVTIVKGKNIAYEKGRPLLYGGVARLPYTEEWMRIASNNGEYKYYPWQGNTIVDVDSSYLLNCYPIEGNYTADGSFLTNSVKRYPSNAKGIYNMAGNVSELTINQNGEFIAKGGSWKSTPKEAQIDAEIKLNKDAIQFPTVGFRPVVEIKYQLKQ